MGKDISQCIEIYQKQLIQGDIRFAYIIVAAGVGGGEGGEREGGAQNHRRHGAGVDAGEFGAQTAPEVFCFHEFLLCRRLKAGGRFVMMICIGRGGRSDPISYPEQG